MDRLRVAAVQMNALRDSLEHNMAIHDRIAREAAGDGCDLIMFPELSTTGHFGHEDATKLAQESDSGVIFDTMSNLAKELGVVICYGFCEKAHGTFYNSQALMGPDGLSGVQRKVHASRDEYLYFRMGRSFEVFDLGFCKVGILICYDVTFFESWRVMALKGAEVLLLPHASRSGSGIEISPEQQQKDIESMLAEGSTRSSIYTADNGLFSVFGNQYGYNGHSTHGGGTYIIGPDGEFLVKGKAVLEESWISATLEPEAMYQARNKHGMPLKARRPEIYGDLSEMV